MNIARCLVALIFFTLIAGNNSYACGKYCQDIRDKLAGEIRSYEVPKNIFTKEIDSGLPNVFHIYLVFENRENIIGVETMEYSVTYDLWDEKYIVQIGNSIEKKTVTVGEKSGLFKLMSSVPDKSVVSIISGLSKGELLVKLRIAYNPVSKEKIEKIKSWVDGQETRSDINRGVIQDPAVRGDAETGEVSVNINTNVNVNVGIQVSSNGPRFRGLFDRILEQRIEETQSLAQWVGKTKTIVINIPGQDNEN